MPTMRFFGSADPQPGKGFGATIELSEDGILVGAPGEGGRGRILRFDNDLVQVAQIDAPEGIEGFGSSVAIVDGGVVGGAPETDEGTGALVLVAREEQLFASGFENSDGVE